jgi:enoyl-CoA hydratase
VSGRSVASEFETFEIELRGAVAVVSMNRPDKLNAMNPTMFRELPLVLATLADGGEARAVVLTGAGEAFSAGGDIAGFAELRDVDAHRRQLRMVMESFNAVERAELPVIAAVNGIAYGGGTELALASDIVLASDRARFAFREVGVGLMPSFGIVRGPEVIGRPWTRRLALSGDIIDAAQALQIGLVQEVFPHAQLIDEAVALAGRIAANPPLAVRLAKRFINADTTSRGLADTIEATALLFASDDHKQAVAAFVGKRRKESQ